MISEQNTAGWIMTQKFSCKSLLLFADFDLSWQGREGVGIKVLKLSCSNVEFQKISGERPPLQGEGKREWRGREWKLHHGLCGGWTPLTKVVFDCRSSLKFCSLFGSWPFPCRFQQDVCDCWEVCRLTVALTCNARGQGFAPIFCDILFSNRYSLAHQNWNWYV